MDNKLISEDSLKAYKNRFKEMQKEKDTEIGRKRFFIKMRAISEQIDNLHVKAKINNFEIESDGPKELGGSSITPGPMAMFLASIANCLEITALLYFSYSNIKVKGIKVIVESHFDKRSALNPKKEPFPGFIDFNITWLINTKESVKKIERILRNIEAICPVKGTLTRTHHIQHKIELYD